MELLHALCGCCAGCQIKKTLAGCGLTMCTCGTPHRLSQQTMERCLTPPPNWKPHLHSFHLEELVAERCLLHHRHPHPLRLQTELFPACGQPLHQPRCLRASPLALQVQVLPPILCTPDNTKIQWPNWMFQGLSPSCYNVSKCAWPWLHCTQRPRRH